MNPRDVGCLSVVMPCYSEEPTVATITQAVFASELVGELVNDGASHGTADMQKTLTDPRLRVIHHDAKRGRGAALPRVSLRHACRTPSCKSPAIVRLTGGRA